MGTPSAVIVWMQYGFAFWQGIKITTDYGRNSAKGKLLALQSVLHSAANIHVNHALNIRTSSHLLCFSDARKKSNTVTEVQHSQVLVFNLIQVIVLMTLNL